LNFPATILTKTKFLQEQYLNEFNYDNLKGKDNYICDYGYRWRSEQCLIQYNQLKGKCFSTCPYQVAKRKFANSNKRLTNFAYFLKSPWIEECPTEFVIVDEAHNFGDEIINAMTLELNFEKIYEKFGNYTLPLGLYGNVLIDKLKDYVNSLKESGRFNTEEIVSILENFLLEGFGTLNIKAIMEKFKGKDLFFYFKVSEIMKKLKFLNEKLIIKYSNEENIIIKPIYPKEFIQFWINKGNKFIFMSATIGNKEYFEEELGIKNSVYYEAESSFPKENRKIVYRPSYNFVYREKDEAIKILLKLIDRVIENHYLNKKENGIIHTPSFSLAWDIKKNSKFGKYMVIPDNPMEVNKYKGKDKIIIGPNFYEGVDFKYDDARWQVITKVPYLELTNPYTKFRMKVDKDWYLNATLKRLEQTIGRIVRSKDDYGITYIFDKQFGRFIPLLPNFIKEAIIKI
jgi:Rad3-related DNA helicase